MARRWARLDRCLANHNWVYLFSSMENHHLPRACSDHSPLLLAAITRNSSKSSIFHFDNYWVDYNACHNIIIKTFEANYHSSPMHSMQHCLLCAKHNLILWRRSGLSPIDTELSNLEAEIRNIEERDLLSPDSWHDIWLHSLHNRHVALLSHNSIFWAQRARMHWLNHGDLNTSFFQRVVKAR